MKALIIPSSIPTRILFLLCLLRPIHGAFTTTTCNPGRNICVEQSQGGSVCFYSTLTSTYSACDAPYSLPLNAHLNQGYAIGYYTATGQYLGRSNYPIQSGSTTAIYVCMSARVGATQYFTLCAQATADNGWQPNGCAVGVAPPTVLDGCYASVSRPSQFTHLGLTNVGFRFLKPPRPGTTRMATTTIRRTTTTLSTKRTSAATCMFVMMSFEDILNSVECAVIDAPTPNPSVVTTTRGVLTNFELTF